MTALSGACLQPAHQRRPQNRHLTDVCAQRTAARMAGRDAGVAIAADAGGSRPGKNTKLYSGVPFVNAPL